MKAIRVLYDDKTKSISRIESAEIEGWPEVCEAYDNDVHRLCEVKDENDYTGLYECYDEHNEKYFYLVEEDKKLRRIKQKVFLGKLGKRVI